jgi:hypothetical protein
MVGASVDPLAQPHVNNEAHAAIHLPKIAALRFKKEFKHRDHVSGHLASMLTPDVAETRSHELDCFTKSFGGRIARHHRVAFGPDCADLEAHYRPLRGITGTLLDTSRVGVSGNDANSIGEKGCSRGATDRPVGALSTSVCTKRLGLPRPSCGL